MVANKIVAKIRQPSKIKTRFFFLEDLSFEIFVVPSYTDSGSSSDNKLSVETSNNFDNATILSIDGCVCPVSQRLMLCLVTFNLSANSSCDILFNFRYFLILSLNIRALPFFLKLYHFSNMKTIKFIWNIVK